MSNELAVIERETSIVKPAGSPREVAEAIFNYKKIQEELDKAMPDCIQHIAGKAFRKKNYWRAVKTAFNLSVENLREDRITLGDDWGYIVTYRATAPNGASADGDGACTYSEKGKGNMIPSLHNIRSQAHTRAFNRAVSNLVGFGEVSAEEIIEEKEQQRAGKPEPVREKVDQPKEDAEILTVDSVVEKVEQKSGDTKGKKWTKYFVTAGGDKFSTFDKDLAIIAKNSVDMGVILRIEYKTGKFGNEIVDLKLPEQEFEGEDATS